MILVHLTLLLRMHSCDLLQQELRTLSTMSIYQITLSIPFEELYKIRYILSFAALNHCSEFPYAATETSNFFTILTRRRREHLILDTTHFSASILTFL
jgi:hypothetical protein